MILRDCQWMPEMYSSEFINLTVTYITLCLHHSTLNQVCLVVAIQY